VVRHEWGFSRLIPTRPLEEVGVAPRFHTAKVPSAPPDRSSEILPPWAHPLLDLNGLAFWTFRGRFQQRQQHAPATLDEFS